MSEEGITGALIGGATGAAIAGIPGGLVGGGLGFLVGEAFSRKPVVESFSTTLQNDLAPENVTLDAHQIYVRIRTGHGAATLETARQTADALSGNFSTRAAQIAEAQNAAADAWQGDASTAALAVTTPLTDSFAVAQQQLAANSQALNAEITAFDHIYAQVEDVPATAPQSGIANSVNPFPTEVDGAINEYNAKAARNVALYEAYSAETAAARGQVPLSYVAPPPLGASGAAGAGAGAAVGATAAPTPRVGPAAGAGQPAATSASAAPDGGPSTPPSPSGASGLPGGGTAGQGAGSDAGRQTPAPTVPSATTPGVAPGLAAGRDSSAAGGVPAGRPRTTPVSDARRGATGAVPGISGAGGRVGGGSAGAAGGGPGGGPGSRGISTGGTGAGGGPGVRGGGPAVAAGPLPGQTPSGQQPVDRGGPGGAGARGAAGLGGLPAAAGRGNGEEDQEYRRKYLIQDDDELFGTDEPFVPPVIGDQR